MSKIKNPRNTKQYSKIWQSTNKCVFCDLKDKYIIYEENGIVLTVNIYPYIDGHLMAIPRDHIKYTKQLSIEQWETIRKFSYIAKKLLRSIYGYKSMWTLIREGDPKNAQTSVPDHLHIHFIPFKKDLCEWHYKDLNFTPQQTSKIFKQKAKNFIKKLKNFENKYEKTSLYPIVVDCIFQTKDKKIVLQKRNPKNKIKDIEFTLPGGHVQDTNLTLELKREIKEEMSIDIDTSKLKLIHNQFSSITYLFFNKNLNSFVPHKQTFLWIIYLYNIDDKDLKNIKCKDDCIDIKLVDKKDLNNIKISDELRQILLKVLN